MKRCLDCVRFFLTIPSVFPHIHPKFGGIFLLHELREIQYNIVASEPASLQALVRMGRGHCPTYRGRVAGETLLPSDVHFQMDRLEKEAVSTKEIASFCIIVHKMGRRLEDLLTLRAVKLFYALEILL